jgi:hypothetical protein
MGVYVVTRRYESRTVEEKSTRRASAGAKAGVPFFLEAAGALAAKAKLHHMASSGPGGATEEEQQKTRAGACCEDCAKGSACATHTAKLTPDTPAVHPIAASAPAKVAPVPDAPAADAHGAASHAPPGHCHYTLEVSAPIAARCGGGECGASLLVPIVRVIPTGHGCPPVGGMTLEERVTPVQPGPGERACGVAPIETGGGCPIDANGFVTRCFDEYAICGGVDAFPLGACVKRAVQTYAIGGTVIARNEFVIRVSSARQNVAGGSRRSCTGTAELRLDPRIRVL